jgi:hypothetical protein
MMSSFAYINNTTNPDLSYFVHGYCVPNEIWKARKFSGKKITQNGYFEDLVRLCCRLAIST